MTCLKHIYLEFYRIDTSRDPILTSFSARGYNSILDNYIGPLNVAAGLVAPIYTIDSGRAEYVDTSKGWFAVGTGSNIVFSHAYVPSGTYKNSADIAAWYNEQTEGSSKAYINLYNIYGRVTIKEVPITFDFTAPTLSLKSIVDNL